MQSISKTDNHELIETIFSYVSFYGDININFSLLNLQDRTLFHRYLPYARG